MKQPRQKKCRICGHKFKPRNTLQVACSIKCAQAVVERSNAKKARKAHREAKERLKTRSEHLKEAQAAFNRYIRLRDKDEPCISCGRFHQGQYHAGHYRTVGANPELRFEELNCHKQCAPCNNHKSGDIVNYRLNLVQKIGQDSVDWLEGPHDPLKLSIDDIKAIKAEYRRKARDFDDG